MSIFRKSVVGKIQVSFRSDKNKGHFTRIFYRISLIPHIIKNVSEKNLYRKWSTHFAIDNLFFPRKSCRSWDNVGKNITELKSPQMTIWYMRIASWIPKSTNTHTEYVTLIASKQQRWLNERSSMLRYTYIACPAERQVSTVTYVSIYKRLNSSLCCIKTDQLDVTCLFCFII